MLYSGHLLWVYYTVGILYSGHTIQWVYYTVGILYRHNDGQAPPPPPVIDRTLSTWDLIPNLFTSIKSQRIYFLYYVDPNPSNPTPTFCYFTHHDTPLYFHSLILHSRSDILHSSSVMQSNCRHAFAQPYFYNGYLIFLFLNPCSI